MSLNLDLASLATTPVMLYRGERFISQGTGFFFKGQESEGRVVVFLATNVHVMTGHDVASSEPPAGDSVRFQCHRNVERPGDIETVMVPTITRSGKPAWLTSAKHPDADIAALPIRSSVGASCRLVAMAEDTARLDHILRVGSGVAVVGYPYGLSDTANGLPVWKAGTIASEPAVDFQGRPRILVDVSAFPGMSGSPVFAVARGIVELQDGVFAPGNRRTFLGVLSDRTEVKTTKESLQLSHVWRASVLLEMIRSFDERAYSDAVLADLPH